MHVRRVGTYLYLIIICPVAFFIVPKQLADYLFQRLLYGKWVIHNPVSEETNCVIFHNVLIGFAQQRDKLLFDALCDTAPLS